MKKVQTIQQMQQQINNPTRPARQNGNLSNNLNIIPNINFQMNNIPSGNYVTYSPPRMTPLPEGMNINNRQEFSGLGGMLDREILGDKKSQEKNGQNLTPVQQSQIILANNAYRQAKQIQSQVQQPQTLASRDEAYLKLCYRAAINHAIYVDPFTDVRALMYLYFEDGSTLHNNEQQSYSFKCAELITKVTTACFSTEEQNKYINKLEKYSEVLAKPKVTKEDLNKALEVFKYVDKKLEGPNDQMINLDYLEPINEDHLKELAQQKNLFITIKNPQGSIIKSIGNENIASKEFILVYCAAQDEISVGHYLLEHDGKIIPSKQYGKNTCGYEAISKATGMSIEEICKSISQLYVPGVTEIPRGVFTKKNLPESYVEIEVRDFIIGGMLNKLTSKKIGQLIPKLHTLGIKIDQGSNVRVGGINLNTLKQMNKQQIYNISPEDLKNVYSRFEVEKESWTGKDRYNLFKLQEFYPIFALARTHFLEFAKFYNQEKANRAIKAFGVLLHGTEKICGSNYSSMYSCKQDNSSNLESIKTFIDEKVEGNLLLIHATPDQILADFNDQLRGLEMFVDFCKKTNRSIDLKQLEKFRIYIKDQGEFIVEKTEIQHTVSGDLVH